MASTEAQRKAARAQLHHEQAIADTLQAKPVNGGESAAVDPIERIRGQIVAHHTAELEWSSRYLKAVADVATSQFGAGAIVLENPEKLSSLAEIVVRATAERDISAQAIEAARQHRRETIPQFYQAQDVGLRAQAAALVAEADERQTKTDELLAQLKAYEGATFEPRQWREASPDGTRLFDRRESTITEMKRQEAAGIEHQAKTIAARNVSDAGSVLAHNRAELLDVVRRYDPLVIAPSIPAVQAWFDPIEAKLRAKLRAVPAHQSNYIDPDSELVIRLNWHNGVIDAAASSARPLQPTGASLRVDGVWVQEVG